MTLNDLSDQQRKVFTALAHLPWVRDPSYHTVHLAWTVSERNQERPKGMEKIDNTEASYTKIRTSITEEQQSIHTILRAHDFSPESMLDHCNGSTFLTTSMQRQDVRYPIIKNSLNENAWFADALMETRNAYKAVHAAKLQKDVRTH